MLSYHCHLLNSSSSSSSSSPSKNYYHNTTRKTTATTSIKEACDEKNEKDYYQKASHYDTLWGNDNIHIGYYPHLDKENNTRIVLHPDQAGLALTERMIQIAGITNTDRVLDLGCGKGLACVDIAKSTNADCTGVDLTPANIERANELASQNGNLKLRFFEGSFTSIPQEVLNDGLYDAVFSQVAFCHAHDQLDVIFNEVIKVLKPGGLLIVNDYLGGDSPPSEETKENVYKRLHFTTLHGHRTWRKIADNSDLDLLYYENLDKHMLHFYSDLTVGAYKHGFMSTDGAALGDNYKQTVHAIERNDIGMNLALFKKAKHMN